MIVKWLARRKVSKLLSQYVSDDLLAELGTEPLAPAPLNKLAQGNVEFVLAAVRAQTPNEEGEKIGVVVQLAAENHWSLVDMAGGLIFLVNNEALPFQKAQSVSRNALLSTLNAALGTEIKIVHGAQTASYGFMGCPSIVRYNVLLPNFLHLVGLLKEVPFGEAREHHA